MLQYSSDSRASRTLIAVPTYNEAEHLEWIIGQLLRCAPGVHILVVDDNSPDGTGLLAQTLSRTQPRIHVLHRCEKQGLGPAYLAAFSWAISGGYTWVAEFDADGSHRPADLQRLLALAHGTSAVDLVIGSRWCRGGGTEGWAITRQILSRLGSAYVNLLLNLGVHDTTAGFRVYRTDFLNTLLQRSQIESRGYGFQIEMTWRSARQGAAIKEVPITFVERRAGTSKMSGSIIREALVEVMRWKLGEIFAPLRFD